MEDPFFHKERDGGKKEDKKERLLLMEVRENEVGNGDDRDENQRALKPDLPPEIETDEDEEDGDEKLPDGIIVPEPGSKPLYR
jgi:hypothetical protein